MNKYFLLSSTLTFLFFILFYSLEAQYSVKRNDHVQMETLLNDDSYTISYTFKDHFSQVLDFEISFHKQTTDRMIEKFGVPSWMMKRYLDTPENRKKRKEVMDEGMFYEEANVIKVDYEAVVEYYSAFCQPIANAIQTHLKGIGKDSRRDRIELTMRFIQDIPYKVPPTKDKEKYYGGIFTPPQLLIENYGDCDSKVLLFVGILSYLIDSNDILLLIQDDHLLTAIKEKPAKGETYIRYKNEAYLIAETAGPGRCSLGQKGNYFKKKYRVEPINIRVT